MNKLVVFGLMVASMYVYKICSFSKKKKKSVYRLRLMV